MLTVATWNLENLFRPAADADAARRQIYQDKLDGLAAAINGLAPDVLAVQEVGDAAAVEDLRDRLAGGSARRALPRCGPAGYPRRLSLAPAAE